jgi:hypothetical protein
MRPLVVCTSMTLDGHGEGPGHDAFGSRTTWNPLLAAGLVDELRFMIGCAAIDGGTPPSPARRRGWS